MRLGEDAPKLRLFIGGYHRNHRVAVLKPNVTLGQNCVLIAED